MLNLPDEDRGVLLDLFEMMHDVDRAPAIGVLTRALETAKPDSGIQALLAHSTKIDGFAAEDQFKTIRVLMALSTAHKVSRQDLDEFLDELIAAPALSLDTNDQPNFRTILKDLLRAPALVETANATSLLDDVPTATTPRES